MRRPASRRQRRREAYTTGEWNKLVDTLLHPFVAEHPEILILDTAAHFIIEQNPHRSTAKFVRYNLPKLLAMLLRKRNAE